VDGVEVGVELGVVGVGEVEEATGGTVGALVREYHAK